jgi:hypothetical protein
METFTEHRDTTSDGGARADFQDLLRRIQAEIASEHGFRVTLPEAKARWSIDYATAIALFRHLTDRGIVSRAPRGVYIGG